ncbi:MAG: hypothetical protein Q8J97_16270, partial [Flavobacteriaceae bacterium]|nr:hypothetical protein [Flavobacteriaceae bacterium]
QGVSRLRALLPLHAWVGLVAPFHYDVVFVQTTQFFVHALVVIGIGAQLYQSFHLTVSKSGSGSEARVAMILGAFTAAIAVAVRPVLHFYYATYTTTSERVERGGGFFYKLPSMRHQMVDHEISGYAQQPGKDDDEDGADFSDITLDRRFSVRRGTLLALDKVQFESAKTAVATGGGAGAAPSPLHGSISPPTSPPEHSPAQPAIRNGSFTVAPPLGAPMTATQFGAVSALSQDQKLRNPAPLPTLVVGGRRVALDDDNVDFGPQVAEESVSNINNHDDDENDGAAAAASRRRRSSSSDSPTKSVAIEANAARFDVTRALDANDDDNSPFTQRITINCRQHRLTGHGVSLV